MATENARVNTEAPGDRPEVERHAVERGWSMGREITTRLRGNWRHLTCWLLDRVFDRYYDRRFGITSSQRLSCKELGLDDANCVSYQPVSYVDFREAMRLANIRPGHDVFVDFGAGMGRAVCLAATYPFRSVVGVEISPYLGETARANLGKIRGKLCCRDVEIITADATQFPVPAEATFFYFFNPFRGPLMNRVLENIARSLRERPRKVSLFCGGSPADDRLLAPFREAPWMVLRLQKALPTGFVGAFFENTAWTGVSASGGYAGPANTA